MATSGNTNNVLLALLQIIAIFSCSYGLLDLYNSKDVSSIFGLVYNGLWFIFGFISNLFGLLALSWTFFTDDTNDENVEMAQYFTQYHFLFTWMTVVVGYPSLVTQTWMAHFPSPINHVHTLLSLIPMTAWVLKKSNYIVLLTQLMTGIALLSHAYISYIAWNVWGLFGAGMIVIDLLALSMPMEYNVWGFSSRSLYSLGLAATSYIFCLAVAETTHNPKQVKSLNPWK